MAGIPRTDTQSAALHSHAILQKTALSPSRITHHSSLITHHLHHPSACFALVAATIINKHRYNGVYDLNMGTFASVSVSGINNHYLSFFDYNRGGYVSGSKTGLYDYPTSSHVSITINGSVVSCFDFESGSYVNFIVNGGSVVA